MMLKRCYRKKTKRDAPLNFQRVAVVARTREIVHEDKLEEQV